jgi:hypothetical protein
VARDILTGKISYQDQRKMYLDEAKNRREALQVDVK